MTKNRDFKQSVRAQAGQDSYTRARRRATTRGGPIMAADLHRTLAATFSAAGWPVVIEEVMENGTWSLFAGPTEVFVSREATVGSSSDYDPDDPDAVNLSEAPQVFMTAPGPLSLHPSIEVAVEGSLPPSDILSTFADVLATGRAAVISGLQNRNRCAICGDQYPAVHLLPPTEEDQLRVCPSCVFDGDLMADAAPEQIALAYDTLFSRDLSIPAGWTAVAALIACAAGPGLPDLLRDLWGPVLQLPGEHWSDPGQLWVWLPPHGRPAALNKLGPGGSLAAVIDAVETAHPDLRERFRAQIRRDLDGGLGDPDEDEPETDYLVERIWPAVIAYAVSMTTQAAERPEHRKPWHVISSFDEAVLAGHFEVLGSELDPEAGLDVTFTLTIGIQVVSDVLLGVDDQPDAAASPEPEPTEPASVPDTGEPISDDEVCRILQIMPALLPAIIGSGCRFVRTADGAIEQRGDGDSLVCRWEMVDGIVHQVVYDRDGNEDARLLPPLTSLT